MDFQKDVKVYFDGSHFIGIPPKPQPWKKRKKTTKKQIDITQNENEYAIGTLPVERENVETSEKNIYSITAKKEVTVTADGLRKVFDRLYDNLKDKKRKEKYNLILAEIKKYLPEEKAKEFVKTNFDRKFRNLIERRKRLSRKVRLQEWDYFCTFTYDNKLQTEESFRKSLSNALKHFSNRKGWKYVGVWERSPDKQRLHFHGLFQIPQMIGELIETKDYSTTSHKMQIANQNTYFLKRFGRNDFKKINNHLLDDSIRYLMKYLEKSGEKIVYSKGLYTYFVTDIMAEDIACNIGVEDRKILLLDNFNCWNLDTGELIGKVSQETIAKLKKCN